MPGGVLGTIAVGILVCSMSTLILFITTDPRLNKHSKAGL